MYTNRIYAIIYFIQGATSKIIISVNPIIIPTVVKFLFKQASGISSDETTPIIAPAENAKSIGNTALIAIAIKTPKTPAIGSNKS